jgi:hypothetical protein
MEEKKDRDEQSMLAIKIGPLRSPFDEDIERACRDALCCSARRSFVVDVVGCGIGSRTTTRYRCVR